MVEAGRNDRGGMRDAAVAARRACSCAGGPFTALSGSWSGGGTITLGGGSREQIGCRADYSAYGRGDELTLSLRCAGDSYNFAFRGNASYRGGALSGSLRETTQDVSGRFTGSARDGYISARVDRDNFTASIVIKTHGERQSISLRSPGSEFSDVTVSLRRK
jgi:hypothetical protein